MKTVFVISGFDIHKTAASNNSAPLLQNIRAKNYNVIPVNISWRQTTLSQYTKQFIDFYNKNKANDGNIVIGNSFGAMVAFITAPELNPDLVLLCSLSPFFSEDLDTNWPPNNYFRIFGKHRIADLKQYSAEKIARKINASPIKVKVLYGQKEHMSSPRLVQRSINTAKSLKDSPLIEIKSAPHSFETKEYIAGIINEI